MFPSGKTEGHEDGKPPSRQIGKYAKNVNSVCVSTYMQPNRLILKFWWKSKGPK